MEWVQVIQNDPVSEKRSEGEVTGGLSKLHKKPQILPVIVNENYSNRLRLTNV
jgi:hypothetical protein